MRNIERFWNSVMRWLIWSRKIYVFNYGQHKSQLISSNSIPHSILDWFFTIIFIGDTFEFLRPRGIFCVSQSVRSSDSIQNWIITQLKIFMAAHHITKGPLSYLSSPLCSFRTSVLIVVFLRNSACVTVCENR